MYHFPVTVAAIALSTTVALAPAAKPAVTRSAKAKAPLIEFER
jgi:hypothetical protein